jgi:DNA mismatch repair protein MutS2
VPASGDALEVLEFGRVLEGVARRAVSDLGKDAVRALRPTTDPQWARLELERVAEVMAFLGEEGDFVPPTAPDAQAALARLAMEGGVLEPGQLLVLAEVLGQTRLLHDGLSRGEGSYPHLRSLREVLFRSPDLENRILGIVGEDGTVLDSASPELKRIRSDLRRIHSRIVQRLESYLKGLPNRFRVEDASVTVREGRYVIPVRREGKGEVGGIVHDESATGHTLFVEPPLALELMNELRELERAEIREVQRILREVSDELRPAREGLAANVEALVAFDSRYARARTALEWDGHVPELAGPGDRGALVVTQGRHPILLLKAEEAVIPFDLALEPDERVLVVSGPNTGGKSVFLKSLGLITLLAQAGIVPPVGPKTRLIVVHRVFTDIGDRQSIQESLSTFSAHLARLMEILEGADAESLVLIDEMGTGTDPAEGAALARAVLETLVGRGVRAVVTSHLGALKTLDVAGSGIVNASLQFDPDRIEPTYQFVKGRPGRSYGLAIARRLGVPDGVLDRAESLMDTGETNLEDLLARLERQEAEARELSAHLEAEREETLRLRTELQGREVRLREAERSADARASADARKLLMEAREEVESAIRELREAGGEALEEASRAARRKVEQAAERHRKLSQERAGKTPASAPAVRTGDRVKVLGSGARGIVESVRDGKASVVAGPLRMQVPVHELEVVESAAEVAASGPRRARGSSTWTLPEVQGSSEVDLRGMRVSEVDVALPRAVDAAVLDGLGEIRIIHGKGTGALRVRVDELLAGDARVVDHRLGGIGEGGAGVTVAFLR